MRRDNHFSYLQRTYGTRKHFNKRDSCLIFVASKCNGLMDCWPWAEKIMALHNRLHAHSSSRLYSYFSTPFSKMNISPSSSLFASASLGWKYGEYFHSIQADNVLQREKDAHVKCPVFETLRILISLLRNNYLWNKNIFFVDTTVSGFKYVSGSKLLFIYFLYSLLNRRGARGIQSGNARITRNNCDSILLKLNLHSNLILQIGCGSFDEYQWCLMWVELWTNQIRSFMSARIDGKRSIKYPWNVLCLCAGKISGITICNHQWWLQPTIESFDRLI